MEKPIYKYPKGMITPQRPRLCYAARIQRVMLPHAVAVIPLQAEPGVCRLLSRDEAENIKQNQYNQ